MTRLLERAALIARAAQAREVGRLAAALAEVRGIAAEAGEGGVTLRGRGLSRRWLIEPALRLARIGR